MLAGSALELRLQQHAFGFMVRVGQLRVDCFDVGLVHKISPFFESGGLLVALKLIHHQQPGLALDLLADLDLQARPDRLEAWHRQLLHLPLLIILRLPSFIILPLLLHLWFPGGVRHRIELFLAQLLAIIKEHSRLFEFAFIDGHLLTAPTFPETYEQVWLGHLLEAKAGWFFGGVIQTEKCIIILVF